MTIYLDSYFKCHVTNPTGEYREIEIDFFNGKCDEFIEGYRYIPEGEMWTRPDGKVFIGKMTMPWKPYNELDDAQCEYEMRHISEYSSALSEIEALIKTPDVTGTMYTIVEVRKQAILSKMSDLFNALYASDAM